MELYFLVIMEIRQKMLFLEKIGQIYVKYAKAYVYKCSIG